LHKHIVGSDESVIQRNSPMARHPFAQPAIDSIGLGNDPPGIEHPIARMVEVGE
jgi:hypothetical protein